MKLGSAYNVFDDCVELLEDSIKSIRDNVDYVSVIYQKVSNYGNPGRPETLDLLKNLQDQQLVDDCFIFTPNGIQGSNNEVNKRNYGLQACRDANCTHFMTMDCDEYYVAEELKNAISEIITEGLDTTICSLQNYFKSPTYQIRPFNKLTVPLIIKLYDNTSFSKRNKFPTLVDPTRKTPPGKWKHFPRETIEMHHFSYVRRNIIEKLQNSSAKGCFKDIDGFIKMYSEYNLGDTFWITEPPGNEHTVEVDNIFNIQI